MSRSSPGALRAVLVGLTAVVALLGGCSGDGSEPAAPSGTDAPPTTATTGTDLVAPQSFQTVVVVVTMADGSTREWCLWLAGTPGDRQRGLMDVTDPELGGMAGMVFAFDADTQSGFWMKDTLLPLSIAWYTADGTLVSTADMDPCPADTSVCPSSRAAGAYRYAIEVPQGRLDDIGLVEGSVIELGGECKAATAA